MKEQYKKFYDLGYNDKSIAIATNSKAHNVGSWRRRNNLPVNRLIHRYGELIKKYVSKGMSNKQISELIPCSSPHIYKIRRELGLNASPHKHTVFKNKEERTKGLIITRTKARAKKKKREFTLTINDIVLVDKCPYLGMPLEYHGKLSKNSASIDRIDNTKGYVPGNIMIISYLANTMKSNASKEEILNFCKNAPNFLI